MVRRRFLRWTLLLLCCACAILGLLLRPVALPAGAGVCYVAESDAEGGAHYQLVRYNPDEEMRQVLYESQFPLQLIEHTRYPHEMYCAEILSEEGRALISIRDVQGISVWQDDVTEVYARLYDGGVHTARFLAFDGESLYCLTDWRTDDQENALCSLERLSVDGQGEILLQTDEYLFPFDLAISPDGCVAYVVQSVHAETQGMVTSVTYTDQIFLMQEGETTLIAQGKSPVWLDERRLGFLQDGQFMLYDVQAKTITASDIKADRYNIFTSLFAAADGDYLLYALGEANKGYTEYCDRAVLIDTGNGKHCTFTLPEMIPAYGRICLTGIGNGENEMP